MLAFPWFLHDINVTFIVPDIPEFYRMLYTFLFVFKEDEDEKIKEEKLKLKRVLRKRQKDLPSYDSQIGRFGRYKLPPLGEDDSHVEAFESSRPQDHRSQKRPDKGVPTESSADSYDSRSNTLTNPYPREGRPRRVPTDSSFQTRTDSRTAFETVDLRSSSPRRHTIDFGRSYVVEQSLSPSRSRYGEDSSMTRRYWQG